MKKKCITSISVQRSKISESWRRDTEVFADVQGRGKRESIPRQECRLRGMRILVIEDDQWNVLNQQKDSERPMGPVHVCKYINACVLLKLQNATMSIERGCPYCTLFWVRTCGSANSIRRSMVVEQEEKVEPCSIWEKRVGDTFLECMI